MPGAKPSPTFFNRFQHWILRLEAVLFDGYNPPQLDEDGLTGAVYQFHTYTGTVTLL